MKEYAKKEVEKLIKDREKAQAELWLLYEISNAMRETLELEQILYIILTAVTSHEGLGFNRAMLFLVNEKENMLEGKMGIGPHSIEEANHIWRSIEEQKMTLEDLINAYHNFKKDPNSKLHNLVKSIKIPLDEGQGILALTVLEGMPFEVLNDNVRKRVDNKYLNLLSAQFFVTVPLRAKDKVVGIIMVDNVFTKKPITKSDISLLTLFANHAGLAIENSRLYEETVYLSNTDWLTKLWNHGHFQAILSREIAKARDNNTSLSLIMVDIDDFKNYNDQFGHVAGDFVIKSIARLMLDASRKKDYVCRYGGEEFAIILPQATKEDAKNIAHRIRDKIKINKFPKQDVQPKKSFTLSCGVATFPFDAHNKDDLIRNADAALLRAKRSGKDRIVLF
ncbi:MAG: sensor domain-containing diguanylate cyclase [Candidatus Omnitrophica bacterium]|nr:sensor domain-containing diguanylate cyclase [Candidatus Omnitrophota bacterium]